LVWQPVCDFKFDDPAGKPMRELSKDFKHEGLDARAYQTMEELEQQRGPRSMLAKLLRQANR
jgi:hypothetical protein